MRIVRRNLVLGALCLVLGGAHWLASRAPAERPNERLFPELAPALAARVRLESAGGERAIELVRSGEEWIVPAAHGHPARGMRVAALVDRVATLTDADLVATSTAEHAAHGVGESALVVRIFGGDDALLAALAQGREANAGPGDRSRATYVRPLGDDRVFRAARLEPLDLDPLAWLDNRWLSIDPLTARALRLRGPEIGADPVEVRPPRGWTGPARELLQFARAMFFDAVLEKDGEPREPALELELELGGEETVVLALGAAEEDGSRAAWRSDSPFVVRFGKPMADPLVARAKLVAEKSR